MKSKILFVDDNVPLAEMLMEQLIMMQLLLITKQIQILILDLFLAMMGSKSHLMGLMMMASIERD